MVRYSNVNKDIMEKNRSKIKKLTLKQTTIDHLYEKINELVNEVVYLRSELERLDKVKAKRTITCGPPRDLF